MKFKSSSGSPALVNIINGVQRLLQFFLGLSIICLYAIERNSGWRFEPAYDGRFEYAIAVGCLTLITSVVYLVLPFLVSYYYVAIAFVWDWILFFMLVVLYARMKAVFPWGKEYTDAGPDKDFRFHFVQMQNAVWVDLAAMIMWLITAITGPVMLVWDRGSLRSTRAMP